MNNLEEDTFIKKNRFNILILFATFNYYIVHHLAQGTFSPTAFSSDKGWGSVWTIVFILSSQASVFWLLLQSETKKLIIDRLALIFIFQIYCFREGDIHTFYTSPNGWGSVANGDFYVQSDAPFMLKCVMGAIFITFFISAVYLLIKYFPSLFKQFFKGVPHAVAFGLWGGLLLFSQICDRSFMNKSRIPCIKNIEEMCELTAAIFAFAAIIQYILLIKNKLNEPGDV